MGLLAPGCGAVGDFFFAVPHCAIACLLLTWPKRGGVRVGVGEGELCGWAAVRNAMVHPTNEQTQSHRNIDRPTDRRGRWKWEA